MSFKTSEKRNEGKTCLTKEKKNAQEIKIRDILQLSFIITKIYIYNDIESL